MLITDIKRDELYRFECINNKIKAYPVNINTFAAGVINIGQALFDLEADIGERSKNEINAALKGVKELRENEVDEENLSLKEQKNKLNNLLHVVGPGEWRWRIRSKINQLEKADLCCNFEKRR